MRDGFFKKTSACDLSKCKSYNNEQHHCFGPSSNQSTNHQPFHQVGNVYVKFTVVLGPLIQSTVHCKEEGVNITFLGKETKQVQNKKLL